VLLQSQLQSTDNVAQPTALPNLVFIVKCQ